MSLDYTKVSHEGLLEDWENRLLADDRFKNLNKASIYQMLIETIAGISDMANYYLGRVAEENYLDTARLDSSVIKLCKNLGYQPKRPIPAQAEIGIVLNGPLPKGLKVGDTIWFNDADINFSFNNYQFLLDTCYSYTLTQSDIDSGSSATWKKTIIFSTANKNQNFIQLDGTTIVNTKNLSPIKVYQGSIKTVEINAANNVSKIGSNYQFYDVDDVTFSNYYGKRDPFAYIDGNYSASGGKCKIGIATTENEALNKNLCDIETQLVELNSNLDSWESTDEKLNICLVTSNPDKTVRISFGNGENCIGGFDNSDQTLYVKYVSTAGAQANKTGTTSSTLYCTSKIYASGKGSVTDVTSNVSFIFNSDITGGVNFESQNSMKINSKLFYSSNQKLITLADWKSYFLSLTEPFTVTNAIAWGEQNVQNSNNQDSPYMQNTVLYSLFGTLYKSYSEGEYGIIDVFADDEDLSTSMLYTSKTIYLNHLIDCIKQQNFPVSYASYQYGETDAFGVNAASIRNDCSDRMMINTNLLSMPPIVHYYDLVGNVLVDKQTNLLTYQQNVEKKIYEWLDTNCSFNTKIYKSDFSKILFENENTRRVNCDIKVSGLIKSEYVKYTWLTSDVKLNYNSVYGVMPEHATDAYYNVIQIPSTDYLGKSISATDLIGKTIVISLYQTINSNAGSSTGYIKKYTVTVNDCQENSGSLYIALNGFIIISAGYSLVTSQPFTISIQNESSYSSTANLNKLSSTFSSILNSWVNSATEYTSTEETPYALPYIVEYNGIDTREQEILRKGTELDLTGLNENAFLYNCVNSYISAVNPTSLDDSKWTAINTDVLNSYPALKPVFDDNVLDDNNNIVNYSCANDISVVRIKLNYVYGE